MHRAEQDSGSCPGRTWQNSVDLAEYGGKWQIAVDCRRLWQSRGRFLIAESVETGGRV